MEKLFDFGVAADSGPKKPRNYENKCRDYVGKKSTIEPD